MTPPKPLRLETGSPANVTVTLVGCGGTGSFAALHLARLAHVARDRFALRLVFVDPDRVETRNIGRQNFCPAETGAPKAVSLARRYSLALGLQIEPVAGRFEASMLAHYRPTNYRDGRLMLICGAVDNPSARRDIAGAVAGIEDLPVWWCDAGNSEHAGQVIIGNGPGLEPTLSPLGYAVGLPWPHVQEPGLLADEPVIEADPLSCADLLALEAQSLMINQAMAGWLAVYAYRLLLAHELDIMRTYIDQRAGTVRSVAITGGVVAGAQAREALGPMCDCGGEMVEGRDEVEGAVVDIMFCAECGFREVVGELVEA